MDYFISDISEADAKKERAKARELRHSAWWKRRLAEGRCYYCGTALPPRELTMDHIVPIIRGGRSTKSNCVAACKDCNTKKKHMIPLEWQEYLTSLGKDDME